MTAPCADALCIALPTSSFLPARGGAEIGLHNIALRLLAKGHRPVVITSLTHKRALRRRQWQLPYEVVAYPPRLLALRKTRPAMARKLLYGFHALQQKRYRFDVWHATFGFPTGVSVIEFCRARAIAHLVRCVGEDIQVRRDIGYGMRLNAQVDRAIRRWLPRAQCLVAITTSVADEYRQIGVADSHVAHIPNGVDLNRFVAFKADRKLRERLQIPDGTPLFLALGRYHRKKNFEQLLETAAQLRDSVSKPFHILIAGTGVKGLAALRSQLGVEDIVTLHEPDGRGEARPDIQLPDDEILNLYKSADVFVMPSIVETFGIVTVEAMAAGLPVIAADSPGSRDVIRNGKDGLIYDGSTSGLSRALMEMLKPDQRDKWAKISLRRAQAFDWDSVVDQYVAAYRQLMEMARVTSHAAHAEVSA